MIYPGHQLHFSWAWLSRIGGCSSLGSPHCQHGRAGIVPQHHPIFAGTVNAGVMVENLHVQVRCAVLHLKLCT